LSSSRLQFPEGRQFAFTIIDDTDVATVENVKPMYRLLESLGMRTTKTVWPVACPEGSRDFSSSQTLEDEPYREFIVDLQRRGFEIASHGATMESSRRDRTLRGFGLFRDVLSGYPRVHANHAYNRENLYWGTHRLDDPVLRYIYARTNGQSEEHYRGHIDGSEYWWGDLSAAHLSYVRNLTFDCVNLLRINPSMPYHDPARPLVKYWFSASDAEDEEEFCRLLSRPRLDALKREGGVCILATHLGKGFVQAGEVQGASRRILEFIASLDGWFPPVGELLDWMLAQRDDSSLPAREWRRMQWRWAYDLGRRDRRKKLQRRLRKRGAGA